MVIRKACVKDIVRVVEIHCSAFDNFFLTSLGPDFLHLYYRAYLQCPEALLLCAEEKGEVLGFSAATTNAVGFNTRLIKTNLIGFMRVGVKLVFTRPMALLRLLRNLTKQDDNKQDDGSYAELYSIGVHQQAQRMGLGRALLIETESRFAQESVQRLSLTTDAEDNDATQAFYQAMGYSLMYAFTAYPNRKMLRLIKQL